MLHLHLPDLLDGELIFPKIHRLALARVRPAGPRETWEEGFFAQFSFHGLIILNRITPEITSTKMKPCYVKAFSPSSLTSDLALREGLSFSLGGS